MRIDGAPTPIVGERLRVARIVRETADSVSIFLERPDGSPLGFEAGQFLSFDVEVEGETLRRAYSIAAPAEGPGSDAPHVTIKRVPDGRVSNLLNDRAESLVGGHLLAHGPAGQFTLPREGVSGGHLLLVAGGSGITPIISLLTTTLHRDEEARVTLVYGNRGEADIIFDARLAELEARYSDRLCVDRVLSDPPAEWKGGVGVLDPATLGARLDLLGVETLAVTQAYVCGPTPMMDAARELLESRGLPSERLKEERFSAPEERHHVDHSERPEPMTLSLPGGARTLVVKPGQTLLEAGLAAAAPMPFSCAMGGCGACKMQVVSGEVAMDEPNCLSEAERARGEVLTCVGYACSPVTLKPIGGAR